MNIAFRHGSVARLALLLVATFGFASSAQSALIFDSFISETGTGFGNTATILSLQETGGPRDGTESGSVTIVMGADELSGDTNPDPQNQTRTLEELMVNSPEEFRLVFDAVEPAGNSITITELTVTFYTSTGDTLVSQSLAPVPVTYDSTNAGNGTNDVVFRLDAQGISVVQAAFTGINPLGDIRVGASATLTNAQGGPDSFAGSSVPTPPAPIPEPTTLALLGIGLLGVGVSARRRKQNLTR